MKLLHFAIALVATLQAVAVPPDYDDDLDFDTDSVISLGEVTFSRRAAGVSRLRGRAENTEVISAFELSRAACCNLGESFTTNPSVDVSYDDAATGARQIKLLGLSGHYVQMLTENIPNYRGSALPYGLSYVPGPWIQSIQVSKGASSVKNGYESLTGQINIEMKKPQADQSIGLNGYVDYDRRAEFNADANYHITPHLSTGLLLHGENSFVGHDDNHDSFLDMPRISQISAFNRWAWLGRNYVFQGGLRFLGESRRGGQRGSHVSMAESDTPRYLIDVNTLRGEAFTKNAYIFDHDNNGNVALIAAGSYNHLHSGYGNKLYNVNQTNVYLSLMFEREFNSLHSLSVGLSMNYDNYAQRVRLTQLLTDTPVSLDERETTLGGYAQYTFNLSNRLLLMAGMRFDHSSVYGAMYTPRFHGRYNPVYWLTIHGNAGRGYHSPHLLAENAYLLASSRAITLAENLHQEDAVNAGGGLTADFTLLGMPLNINTEYYYTNFHHQTVIDLDQSAHEVVFRDLQGRSFSRSYQVDVTLHPMSDLMITAAYRFTDAQTDYGRGLQSKPLTSRRKALFTLSWTPQMGIWQFDASLALNGGGRMPTPGTTAAGELLWAERFNGFAQLNAQITRNFRHWAVYIGAENLTNYTQKNPVVSAHNPWGSDFDATMIYGPLHGANVYVGFRYNFTRY